ncbi:hypothetical protein [Capnocytophaga sp.]|nr:hypothetical protein [Capnocytophaga sp.]
MKPTIKIAKNTADCKAFYRKIGISEGFNTVNFNYFITKNAD